MSIISDFIDISAKGPQGPSRRPYWRSKTQSCKVPVDITSQAITQHIRAIYEDQELDPAATCKELLQVRQEGKRRVRRQLKAYSLPMILAVGYRVRSPRGTQFRQWATAHLEEYLVKGFIMDDQRLKEPGGRDYFDELLARIREALLPEGSRTLCPFQRLPTR